MALQLLLNETQTITAVAPVAITSAAVAVYNPDGDQLQTGSATLDTTSAVIVSQAADSPETLTVETTTGFVVNRPYLLTSVSGQTSVIYLSEIDGQTLIFDQPPSFDITHGDTVTGALVSFAVSGAHLGSVGLYYRAEFTFTPSSGDKFKQREMFHVCRTQFSNPVDLDDVKRVLAFQYPSAVSAYQTGQLREMAQRASQMVLRQIEASGKMPHLVSAPGAFKDAGLHALRLVLADDNLIPQAGTTDMVEYTASLRENLAREVQLAIKSGQWYDENDDGKVQSGEVGAFSTRVVL